MGIEISGELETEMHTLVEGIIGAEAGAGAPSPSS